MLAAALVPTLLPLRVVMCLRPDLAHVRGRLIALTCRFLAFRKRICALTRISCWRAVFAW